MVIRAAFALMFMAIVVTAKPKLDGEFIMHKNNTAPERLNFANHLWNCKTGWAAGSGHSYRGLSVDKGGLDSLGYPKLSHGAKATTLLAILPNMKLHHGRFSVTWRGDAKISVSKANVIETADHRLELTVSQSFQLTVTAGPNYARKPLRHLRVWLPDPEARDIRSLAPGAGQPETVIHPTFVRTWKVPGISVWRVAFAQFNNNPQENWEDTRHPDHCFMMGSVGTKQVPGRSGVRLAPKGEVAWAQCIYMTNALDSDIWVNVPHGATDSYVRALARVLFLGSDENGQPITIGQKPFHPPVKANRKVYVELSNEMWHPGFHQGIWAGKGAKARGIPWGAFPAKRVAEIWSLFQGECEKAEIDWRKRLVRVAACSDGRIQWTSDYLKAAFTHGKALPEMDPKQTIGGGSYKLASEPDTLATANYFGNNIACYSLEMSKGGGAQAFWQIDETPVRTLCREWERRLLVGSGGSNWVNATTGTIELEFMALAKEYKLPVIGYEGGHGGPELRRQFGFKYPEVKAVGRREKGEGIVRGTLASHAARIAKSAGVQRNVSTDFSKFMRFRVMESPGMEHVMRLQLELLKADGMRMPCNSGALDNPAIMNDWGLTEYLAEPMEEAPRLRAVLSFVKEHRHLNEVGESHGKGAPRFDTPASILIPRGKRIKSIRLRAKGGDAPLKIRVFGAHLPEGLTFDQKRNAISGQLTGDQPAVIFARVQDRDGDIAYRKFTVEPIDPRLGKPIWRETFDDVPDGSNKDTGPTAWTISTSGEVQGTCMVTGGRLEAIGVKPERGNGEFIWRTQEIDISRHKRVNLRIAATSNDGVDRGGDWLRITYSIDGGTPVKIADFSGKNAIVKDPVVKAMKLSGKKLVIEARLSNSNTEMYGLSEVGVFATK